MRQSPCSSLSAARLQLPISGQSPSPQPTKHTPAPAPTPNARAAANRTRPEHSYWQHSSTFPPFAPSRITLLNQAILAIPPFPCANTAQHARPRRECPL